VRIEIDKVSKKFGGMWALDEVSLTLEPGQIFVLLGANGAGKTTLLNCMAGILAPDKGVVYYDGEKFNRGKMELRRRLMFLPDFPLLFGKMTVLEHLAMCVKLYEVPAPDGERVARILEQLSLLTLVKMQVGRLSRGQLYKCALAALLVIDPELWILDEPLASGMDPLGIALLKRESRAATKRGRTILYTTQILEVAEKFADRIGVLDHGGLRINKTIEELQTQAQSGSLEDVLLTLRDTGEGQ
jgi:ABC-type multidrug transport system ATPase subunit